MRFSEKVVKTFNLIEANIFKNYGAKDVKLSYSNYRRRIDLLNDVLPLILKGLKMLNAGSVLGTQVINGPSLNDIKSKAYKSDH